MSTSTVCWGIEIGASAIKAVKLELQGDDRVKVLEFAVIQHPKPLSTPGVDANDVLRVSLGAFTSQFDLTKAAIAVSVPGHAGFARFAKLPPVDPKKVPQIVKFEAMQQIPFPLEQVEWDYQTFVSPDSPEIEVGIFAITKERVNERLTMLADFGIHPDHVVLSPIAVYNALAYDLQFDSKTPGTIIVDVGTTSTDLVVATPGRMWVRTFPIGGHEFTEAMVSQFQLSYPKAEKLKREAEDSKHARQVFQAMRPVFTDMAQDIQRSIGYYQSLNKDAQLTRLIGVGSTFNLPGLRKYLKQQLSLDVYRIEEFKRAPLDGTTPGDDKSKAYNDVALNLCTAYGLALQGLGLNAVGGNLMPVSILRKAMWKEKVPWFGLAAGVAALAGGAMFIGPVKDYFEVNGEHGAAPAVIETTIAKAEDLKKQAKAAGVTEAGEPQLAAANMVALADRKGTYARIVADVQDMLAAADAARSDPAVTAKVATSTEAPAFSVLGLTTTYQPPVAANSGEPMLYQPAPENDLSAKLKIDQYPRVKCVMTLSCYQPVAGRFTAETIQKWLNMHASRSGVPYTIKIDEPCYLAVESKNADAASAPSGGAGETAPAPASGRGGGGGGGGKGAAPRIRIDEERPQGRQPGLRMIGEGSPAAAAHQANMERTAAVEQLDKLAPMTEPPPLAPPRATVTVTWWATFIPPATTPEGGTK